MIFAVLKKRIKKPWFLVLVSLVLLCFLYGTYLIFGDAVTSDKKVRIRIRKGWTLQQLSDSLVSKAGLKHPSVFRFVSENAGYKIPRPGVIQVLPGSNLYSIVNLLKANRNQTVNIAIRGSMDATQLAMLFSSKLEVDKDSFLLMLKDRSKLRKFDVTDTTWATLFIPNTYNLYASTELNQLMDRMHKEYALFWNSGRKQRSIVQRLTFHEVLTLASIVTKESNKTDEYEQIAGVYLNRLRIGMPLQADPTVVYARGRAGRVWAADLAIQSPYNTYLHKGLPPGPICIPNLQSIEAVLNYKQHNYLYFCARADFSGYHDFAISLADHNRNAAAFHRAMNERGIK
jgi:UPF0755 protein